MLFNKDTQGTDELREHISFLYAAVDFEDIKTDLELAQEDLNKIIGQEVYEKALSHYLSDDYENGNEKVLDELVHHIQLPVALFAVLEYSKNNDVSHESTGRRLKIDPEREKIPFDWMLDRDSAAILSKAHKTTDRLIAFLEKHSEETDWINTDAQKTSKRLFINTAEAFDKIYPINQSRLFFLRLIPFMEETERKHIKAILNEHFQPLKDAILQDNLSESQENLLIYVREAVVMRTMEKAVSRMAVSVFPESVFQSLHTEINSPNQGRDMFRDRNKANNRREMAVVFGREKELAFKSLQEQVAKLNAPETYEDSPIEILPRNEKSRKFFRT